MAEVTLVTGPVNSGKTTFALDLCRGFDQAAVDGFASRKRLVGGVCVGYELMRLSGGPHRMLAIREDRSESAKGTKNTIGSERTNGTARPFGSCLFLYGPFLFFEEAFREAKRTFTEMLANPHIEHILVDEIGPVELGGRGFADSLRSLLASDRHLILCVRDVCVTAVMADFSIRSPEILCVSLSPTAVPSPNPAGDPFPPEKTAPR